MKKYWTPLIVALLLVAVPVTLANGMMYHGRGPRGMMGYGWPAVGQGYGLWGPWRMTGWPTAEQERWEGHGCPMMEYYENYEESYGWPSHGSWMGYWGPMMGYMGIYPQFNRTAQQPESAEVIIRGFMYHPQVLRVQKGATVTWTNLDPTEHTITFEGGLEDSGPIAYGQSFSYTFDEEGKYYYSCTLHPYTIGAIIVRG